MEHEAFQVPPLERPAGGDPQPPDEQDNNFAALLGQAGMAQDQAAQWGAMLRGVQRSVNRGLPLERTCLLGLLLRVSGGASYRNDIPLEAQARGLRELMQRVRRPQDVPSATRELTQQNPCAGSDCVVLRVWCGTVLSREKPRCSGSRLS